MADLALTLQTRISESSALIDSYRKSIALLVHGDEDAEIPSQFQINRSADWSSRIKPWRYIRRNKARAHISFDGIFGGSSPRFSLLLPSERKKEILYALDQISGPFTRLQWIPDLKAELQRKKEKSDFSWKTYDLSLPQVAFHLGNSEKRIRHFEKEIYELKLQYFPSHINDSHSREALWFDHEVSLRRTRAHLDLHERRKSFFEAHLLSLHLAETLRDDLDIPQVLDHCLRSLQQLR